MSSEINAEARLQSHMMEDLEATMTKVRSALQGSLRKLTRAMESGDAGNAIYLLLMVRAGGGAGTFYCVLLHLHDFSHTGSSPFSSLFLQHSLSSTS